MRTASEVRPAQAARRDRWIFLAITLLAFALRLAAVLQYQHAHPNAEHPVIDELAYDRWARAIAGGDWLGKDVFFQEPLYPYLLGALYALFGPERFVARVAQCVAWAAASLLAGLLGRRVFGRQAGFVAAAAVALYQPGLIFPSLLLKENLFLPLFALFALLLVRTRDADEGRRGAIGWFAVGVTGALGALLRGNMLVLLPFVAAWPLARRFFEKRPLGAGAVHAACVLAGCALVLVPVGLRNQKVGGLFVLTTTGAGTNLYVGNNLENPYGRATEFSFIRGIPEHEAGDWKREAERRSGRELDPAQVSEFWRDQTFASVRAHPWQHARILWNKLRLTLGSYEVPDNHLLAWDARYVPLARWPLPAFGVLGALGLAGILAFAVARIARRRPDVAGLGSATELAILFALYLATIVLTVTCDRMRLPLVALLAPFAGWIVVEAWSLVRARRGELMFAVILSLAAGFAFVDVPVLSAQERDDDFDKRDYNLCVQVRDEPGRLEEAREMAAKLVQAHPESARLQCLVGEIDWRKSSAMLALGDARLRKLARENLEGVLKRVEPIADDKRVFPRERFRAQSLAAWVALDLGDWARAEKRFREARAFDGDAPDLKRGLARALLALEDARRGETGLLQEAGQLIASARSSANDPADVADLEILQAQAEFQEGRDTPGTAGQVAITAALKRLQAIGESKTSSRAELARSRMLAGWIQLYLGSPKPAENLFRNAIKLQPTPNARLGLANALAMQCEATPPIEGRDAKLAEARTVVGALLRELEGGEPDETLEKLVKRLDLLH